MILRYIALIFLTHSLLFAYSHEDVIRDYKAKEYKKLCIDSAVLYKNNEKNEKILSLIGDACAKVDYINPLGYVVRGLISTPKYRENGSYFATLVLQKKLIYQFMHDGIDLKHLRLPRTEHVLSVVFEHLATKQYTKKNGKIIIKTEEKEYRLWLDDAQKSGVHVDVYQDDKLVDKHWYL